MPTMTPFADIRRKPSMLIRTANDFGLVIREWPWSLRLDQGELAGPAGVSRQWIVDMSPFRQAASWDP